MKVSDLIYKLSVAMSEVGDIDVYFSTYDPSEFGDEQCVEEVRAEKVDGYEAIVIDS